MSEARAVELPAVESAEELAPESREALRALILTLADNKRLLGIRYSDCMLGAPTLETGIAASSMAQDEWGHGRLTYALLSDLGDDPKRLEHEREAGAYHSMEAFDRPFGSFAEMIAAALVLDTAIALQYAALVDSRYSPVHNRVQKLLDEEAFHFQYATGWTQRLAAAAGAREPLHAALARFLPLALRWLGREDDAGLAQLRERGIVRHGPDELRRRLLRRVAPVLAHAGLAEALGLTGGPEDWDHAETLQWEGWDGARRRGEAGGPDAETLARVRGDKNRAMLLD